MQNLPTFDDDADRFVKEMLRNDYNRILLELSNNIFNGMQAEERRNLLESIRVVHNYYAPSREYL